MILFLFAFALYFYRLRRIGEWPYLTREQVIARIIRSAYGKRMERAAYLIIADDIMRGDL